MSIAAAQTVLPIIDPMPEPQSGIFPSQMIRIAIERKYISALTNISSDQIQPASLDLRLGSEAFRVPASFLPGARSTVQEKIKWLTEERLDLQKGAILKKGCVYIVPLEENLSLRKRVSAVANPKSSTGRLDVFARVITDFGTEFDNVRERYNGPLWAELAPRSFNVLVRQGSRLVQMRIRRGTPPSSEKFVRTLQHQVTLVRGDIDTAHIKDAGIPLSVDIDGNPVSKIIGYKAKKTTKHIDVDKINHYNISDFWKPVYRPKDHGVILGKDDFHILVSKERIAVPSDYAAEMVAYDTLVGEFRVHYAGFFDPGFGYFGSQAIGTRAVLEVRSHEVPFVIEDGQVVGRLMVERLTEPCDRPYGATIGSSYYAQDLTLSKQFKR